MLTMKLKKNVEAMTPRLLLTIACHNSCVGFCATLIRFLTHYAQIVLNTFAGVLSVNSNLFGAMSRLGGERRKLH